MNCRFEACSIKARERNSRINCCNGNDGESDEIEENWYPFEAIRKRSKNSAVSKLWCENIYFTLHMSNGERKAFIECYQVRGISAPFMVIHGSSRVVFFCVSKRYLDLYSLLLQIDWRNWNVFDTKWRSNLSQQSQSGYRQVFTFVIFISQRSLKCGGCF